jgi:hypothetical protein
VKSVIKNIIYRVLAMAAGLLLVFLGGEIVLRVMYFADRARGGDLQQRLEKSAKTELGQGQGEVSMRGLVKASEYKDIVYESKPNLKGTFRGKILETSSLGIRDKEYATEKPAGAYRIVGLGDSVMFGWGVNQGECYLDVLEQRLNALPGAHPLFEVLNFALPGYNTAIEVAVFEHKALPLNPDLVVIHFVSNDTGVPLFMESPKGSVSLKRSYFLDFIRARLGLGDDGGDGLVGNSLKDVEDGDRGVVLEPYRYMVGEQGCREALQKLSVLTRDRGIPVIIVQGNATEDQKKMLRAVAAEHGFHLLDVRPYTDAYVRENGIPDTKEARRQALWVGGGDSHPNARAHTIFVAALMDELAALGITTNQPANVSP